MTTYCFDRPSGRVWARPETRLGRNGPRPDLDVKNLVGKGRDSLPQCVPSRFPLEVYFLFRSRETMLEKKYQGASTKHFENTQDDGPEMNQRVTVTQRGRGVDESSNVR